jgi:hypothetical protein
MAILRKLTAEDKEELVQRVSDVHRSDPGRLRSVLPEVADLLDGVTPPGLIRRGNESPFGLTERELNFHKEALANILRRFKTLTPAEAVEGLEHGANLLVDDFTPGYPPRQELLKLVRKATGIQPRKTGKPAEKAVREGESSRTVPVVRGLDLHLTWEFKLIKVTMDPNQWRLRSQALGIIGIGKETAADVAENHDDYLMDAFQNG